MTSALRVYTLGVAATSLTLRGELAPQAIDALANLPSQLDAADPAPVVLLLDAAAMRLVGAGALHGVAARLPVVVVDGDAAEAAEAFDWIARGVDDVCTPGELAGEAGARRLQRAVIRHRRWRLAAPSHATDVATGLPHRRQFIEHLSQLIALRERDPSPMAVLAFRAELPELGHDDGDLLRRKAAVRLRAAVRSSDVVGVADDGTFCVLLGSLLDESDAPVVAAKLTASLAAPFRIGPSEVSLAVAHAVALHPRDGDQADRLMRRAVALAAAAPALRADRDALLTAGSDGSPRAAANDVAG